MAIKRSFTQTKTSQREATFAGTYSWSKVTGMKEGMEKYIIFLGLDQGIFQTPKHHVNPRGGSSFKNNGKFGTDILCKSYDENGEFVGEAECCRLQKLMYEKYPNKDDASKRIIGAPSWKLHLPVLVLGNSETDPKVTRIPVQKLSLRTYQFSYLEMSLSTWNSEMTKLGETLKTSGAIDFELEGDELREALQNYVQNSVVKVSALHSDKGLVYEKAFNFIPFSTPTIGKATEEYKHITQYTKLKSLNQDLVDFMTLFNAEVDNLVCSNWEDGELEEFVLGQTKAEKTKEKIKEAEDFVNETEDDVELLNDDEVPFDENGFIEETEKQVAKEPVAVGVTEDDTTFAVEEGLDEFFD